jgi:pimeloyl-ACP methyl ester carboxylesterase
MTHTDRSLHAGHQADGTDAAVRRFTLAQAAMLNRWNLAMTSRFVDVDGIEGRAHVLCRPTEGKPVVLVNGIGIPAAMWAPLMAQLDGFSLYAVDLPGFGLTGRFTDPGGDYRRNAVTLLAQVVQQLGLERPVFVANSMGSLWTTWLALDQPNLVAAMSHVGCPAVWFGTSAPLPMRLLSVRGLGGAMMRVQPPSPRQVRQLSKMVNEDPLPPELADLLLATEQLTDHPSMFLFNLRAMVRLRGARPTMTFTADQAAQVTQPVQLIWGDRDPFGDPTVGMQAARSLACAEPQVVPGGHAPWVHHSEVVARHLIPFLSKKA